MLLPRVLLQVRGARGSENYDDTARKSKARLIWSVNVALQPVTRTLFWIKRGAEKKLARVCLLMPELPDGLCHQAGPFSGVTQKCRVVYLSYKHSSIYIQNTGGALTSCRRCLSPGAFGALPPTGDLTSQTHGAVTAGAGTGWAAARGLLLACVRSAPLGPFYMSYS